MSGFSFDDPDFQYLAVDRKKMLEEQNQPFDGKRNCWIIDKKEGYMKAEIISTKGDDVTVITEKKEVRIFRKTFQRFISLLFFVYNYLALKNIRMDKNKYLILPTSGENGEEGFHPANESSEVREDRGHGQSDLFERGLGSVQLEVEIQLWTYLRQSSLFSSCFFCFDFDPQK